MNRLPSVLFVHMQKFVFYELIRSKNSCSVHVHGSNCRDADSEIELGCLRCAQKRGLKSRKLDST